MGGFINKRQLTRWNKEDLQRAKDCRWMIDREIKENKDNFIKTISEYLWWNKKLLVCLPSKEKYEYIRRINSISIIFQFSKFKAFVRRARYDIVMKLIAYDYQKEKMLEEKEPIRPLSINLNIIENENKPTITLAEQIRLADLSMVYPSGSPADKKQKEEKINGYVPTFELLSLVPPIEVIEYCGIKLKKYDKLHGYFSIVLIDNHCNTNRVLYSENANEIETLAEQEFETLVEEKIKSKENGYGNKSYEEVDISNITENMGYNSDSGSDVLNKTDIF